MIPKGAALAKKKKKKMLLVAYFYVQVLLVEPLPKGYAAKIFLQFLNHTVKKKKKGLKGSFIDDKKYDRLQFIETIH